ncbi:hypothetical protein [Halorhabdus amylolytica]|uniref:hypothetical protein n=1 Tax=Halorhabdus amylolytica TaxID=2559573 RepID=UPI0010AA40F1|nr:hypothetical protein [Halorhabdus amylolytica]
MSRMGAQGYSNAGKTQVSARVPETLKTDFKEACENADTTMTDVFEDAMAEFVEEYGDVVVDVGTDEYYPTDSHERELYEACLKFADEDLMIYQRRHASAIAQKTQQVTADNLTDALEPLRKKGFIARGPMPVGLTGEGADRWRHWRVKPACADPQQWKYREEK